MKDVPVERNLLNRLFLVQAFLLSSAGGRVRVERKVGKTRKYIDRIAF